VKEGWGGNYTPPPVRNGPVSTSVGLACALHYFAGSWPYDIMVEFPLHHCMKVYERSLRL